MFNLSSWCLVMVERLFFAMPRGCLRFVIVVFPDHTHYFLRNENMFIPYSLTISSASLWESVIVLCFVVHYFMSILVLQSS